MTYDVQYTVHKYLYMYQRKSTIQLTSAVCAHTHPNNAQRRFTCVDAYTGPCLLHYCFLRICAHSNFGSNIQVNVIFNLGTMCTKCTWVYVYLNFK